jgi:drug/metabolite transporter (DMT)-like permease
MSKNLIAHMAVLLANVIYGLNYFIAKIAMPAYIKPIGFILIRVIIATALFWLIAPLFKREKIAREDFMRLFWCGLFGIAINQMLFFMGLDKTSSIDASIIMICTPVLVMVVAFLIGGEKITALRLLGIALGAGGAAMLLLLSPAKAGGQQSSLLGNSMILVNALSYGIYLVIAKPLMLKYHPLTVLKWSFLFGMFICLPFGLEQAAEVNWATITGKGWFSIIYVIIAATFFAYLLNNLALGTVSSSVVGVYIYLQPVIAAIVEISVGNSAPDAVKILSALLIFTGVYLVGRPVKAKALST